MALSAFYRKSLATMAQQPSRIQARAQALQAQWSNEPQDAAEWMELMLATERLAKIYFSGKANDVEMLAKLEPLMARKWEGVPELPCAPGQQKRLAETMMKQIGLYPAPTESPATLHMLASFQSHRVTQACVQHCLDHGITADIKLDDGQFDAALVNGLDEGELQHLVDFNTERYLGVTHMMGLLTIDPDVSGAIPAEKSQKLESASKEFNTLRAKDEVRWVITKIPTVVDGEREGMTYPEYVRYFFDACDQPWEQIEVAQKKLIERFNAAKQLHITNDDGTDVTMLIDGHTFANSMIRRNIPGSEFFSAPVRRSVNGTVVAKGTFYEQYQGVNYRIKDIRLEIKNGRIMSAQAAEGEEALNRIIAHDDHRDPSDPEFEGARHFGEIGIGTNPFIRRHLSNGLLVEKISGSFHLAVGAAYGSRYLGEPVSMDNGNKSDVHWDITTMLVGKSGRMELDGHLVQENGEWIACPALGITAKDVDVLNRGWKALPEAQQPKYWRDKFAAEQKRER